MVNLVANGFSVFPSQNKDLEVMFTIQKDKIYIRNYVKYNRNATNKHLKESEGLK